MRPLSNAPASTYRRIDLDARIEASSGEDLTRICLEEAIAALGQALFALERESANPPREPLVRAQGIALWLARAVAPENPLKTALTQFYGGVANAIRVSLARPDPQLLSQVRNDLQDVLNAAHAA